MPNSSPEHPLICAERRVLQALCQGTTAGSVREFARCLLVNYRWREPIHQALFDCLMDFPSVNPQAILDQLPARVTRKGFPDVAWDEFFQPVSISRHEAEELMRQLRDSSSAGL